MTTAEKREYLRNIFPSGLRYFRVKATLTTSWAEFVDAHKPGRCGLPDVELSSRKPLSYTRGLVCQECHLIYLHLPLLRSRAQLVQTLRHELVHVAQPYWCEAQVLWANGEFPMTGGGA